jgi:hypothetical protein
MDRKPRLRRAGGSRRATGTMRCATRSAWNHQSRHALVTGRRRRHRPGRSRWLGMRRNRSSAPTDPCTSCGAMPNWAGSVSVHHPSRQLRRLDRSNRCRIHLKRGRRLLNPFVSASIHQPASNLIQKQTIFQPQHFLVSLAILPSAICICFSLGGCPSFGGSRLTDIARKRCQACLLKVICPRSACKSATKLLVSSAAGRTARFIKQSVEMANLGSSRSSGQSCWSTLVDTPDSMQQFQAGQGGGGSIYGHLTVSHTGDVALQRAGTPKRHPHCGDYPRGEMHLHRV